MNQTEALRVQIYLRQLFGSERLIVAVPRRLGRLEGSPTDPAIWEDTMVPLPADWPRRWSCALSGRSLAAGRGGLIVAESVQE